MATKAPELEPWLPLLGAVLDVEIAATPEVDMLAEKNRRTKLHETVARFLQVIASEKVLFEIDDVHHMDEASAELLSYLARRHRRAAVALRGGAPPGRHRVQCAGVARRWSESN